MSELQDKVCPREQAVERVAALKHPVVFTNGVFDVLHRGHVNYLHEARKMGGSLVVAVNSDASARMLGKGPDRPLNRAEDRAAVLAGLESVSLVTFFDERTPVSLIEAVRPDLYVKGGDYDMEALGCLPGPGWGDQPRPCLCAQVGRVRVCAGRRGRHAPPA